MNYGEVLSRAWQIIWKHKVLWIFGILAGCGSAGGGGGRGNVSYTFGGNGDLPPGVENFFHQFERIPDWQVVLILAFGVLLVFLIIVLAVFLSTMGRIGMYRGTQLADQGEARLTFGDLFRGGLPYFWRVFFLNLLVGLVIFALIILIIGLGILATVVTFGIFLICAIPLICLAVPIGWLVGVWIEQANIAIVVENLGITAGLKRGWQVFSDNLGPMIVMGLILIIGIGLIGGFIIALPLFLIVVPALVGTAVGSQTALNSGLIIAGLCLVIYLPVLIVLGGILMAYIESAWTLTYLRLTGKPAAIESVVEVIS